MEVFGSFRVDLLLSHLLLPVLALPGGVSPLVALSGRAVVSPFSQAVAVSMKLGGRDGTGDDRPGGVALQSAHAVLVGVVVGRGDPVSGVQRCSQTDPAFSLGHIQGEGAMNLHPGVRVAAHLVYGAPTVPVASALVGAPVAERFVVEAGRIDALGHVVHRCPVLRAGSLVRIPIILVGSGVQPPGGGVVAIPRGVGVAIHRHRRPVWRV